MNFVNCKKCGKIFTTSGSPICPECVKKSEEKFLEVRKYIYENPSKNMAQVAEETEVPVRQIQQWVREEKLLFSKDSGVMLECENCGKAIQTGRFCKECKGKMSNKLSGLYVEKNSADHGKRTSGGKMHFLK